MRLSVKEWNSGVDVWTKPDFLGLLLSAKNSYFKNNKLIIISNDKNSLLLFLPQDFSIDHKRTAFFWWDSRVSDDLVKTLIQKAEQLALEKGYQLILGPLLFSTYFDYRLKLDAFDQRLQLGEPQNTESATLLLKSLDYEVVQNYRTDSLKWQPAAVDYYRAILKSAWFTQFEANYEVEKIDEKIWFEKLEVFYKLSQRIFLDNFAYRSVDFEIFKAYYGNIDLVRQIDFQTSLLLKKNDVTEPIGLILNFRSPENELLIKTAGIVPEHRNLGQSFLYLLAQSILRIQRPTDFIHFCLMKDGNFPSLLTSKLDIQKRSYGLFGKNLKA